MTAINQGGHVLPKKLCNFMEANSRNKDCHAGEKLKLNTMLLCTILSLMRPSTCSNAGLGNVIFGMLIFRICQSDESVAMLAREFCYPKSHFPPSSAILKCLGKEALNI